MTYASGNYAFARQRQLLREKQERRLEQLDGRSVLDAMIKTLPTSFEPRTGLVTGWVIVYNNPKTRKPFVSNHRDSIQEGSFSKTIAALYQARQQSGHPHLCQYRYLHKHYIGGVTELHQDIRGVWYVAQIDLLRPYAKEAFHLAQEKRVGSSAGFDTVRSQKKDGITHIHEAQLIEISLTPRPANPYALVMKAEVEAYEPVFADGRGMR